MEFMLFRTGEVPPWSHDTSKLDCLRALGSINPEDPAGQCAGEL